MAYDPDFDAFHQFHVTIIHHSKIDPDDEAEKEWVRELMNLLAPEIWCFKSILINIYASSSLLSVTIYFNSLLPLSLCSFEYLCDINDSEDVVFHEPYDGNFVTQESDDKGCNSSCMNYCNLILLSMILQLE